MVTLIIILSCLGSAVIAYFLIFKLCFSSSTQLPSELVQFKQEHQLLENAVKSLTELAADYFNTLNNSGFTELVNIEGAIGDSIRLCEQLLEDNRKEDAGKIIYYLFVKRGLSTLPNSLLSELGEKVEYLPNYATRSKELLEQIEISIAQASNELKEISPHRRARKRTEMLLNQAKNYFFTF